MSEKIASVVVRAMRIDPNFLVVLGVSLLGLALSAIILPLFAAETSTVLAFAG